METGVGPTPCPTLGFAPWFGKRDKPERFGGLQSRVTLCLAFHREAGWRCLAVLLSNMK